jgi:predicted glycosyltransferase
MHRYRLLFYCQSLVGAGHLSASLEVIRALLQHSDVDLIYGGQDVEITLEHSGFRFIRLATILINDQTGELFDPDQRYSVLQLWAFRAQQITSFLALSYDAIVVEFFPFGRRRFKKEIYALFDQVKKRNNRLPIFSFVREVLVPDTLESERNIVASVNQYIHTIFIRGDADVIRLDETFLLTPEIADKIQYMGYLGSVLPESAIPRKPQILVSLGGGCIDTDLLEAAINVAPLLPNYGFVIATGAKTSAESVAKLTALISSSNVKVVPYLQNFKQHLAECSLSISMGGDNTLIEVISTRTPGLAYPYPGNSEQKVRINKLAEKGLIYALTPYDLKPEKLHTKIVAAINSPITTPNLKLHGAINMSEKIQAILANS